MSEVAWFVRVVAAGAFIVLLPGLLTLIAWRPREAFNLLEAMGVSVGISFALVQLLTIGAVMYAWPVDVSLGMLCAWMVAHGLAALRRRQRGVAMQASRGEVALLATIVLVSVALYVAGSPFDTTEPRIHIALVRRILHLPAPTLYNMYVAPDVVYTYPFPATHYALALMARVGGIDPLFLYTKTRVIWGIAAPVLLYGCVLATFGSRRIALASAFVAVGLVANGAFGAVPGFSWAQLAPYSHASDIAMGVLLPALLLMTLEYLGAAGTRERRFFLAGTLALALMLVMVHPREIVQFLVYLTVFASAVMLWRRSGVLAPRAVVVILSTIVLLLVYRGWQQTAVPAVDAMVERERQGLTEIFRDASLLDLVGRPLPLLRNYMVAFEPTFHGWNPAVLFASPFVLFALRKRPLALVLAASTVCYLLIIRLPFLGIPYIYLTYFEILYTPIRNVILFVHMLAGVAIYLVAARLSRYDYPVALASALAVSLMAALALSPLRSFLMATPAHADWLFIPVLTAYVALGWRAWRTREQPVHDEWLETPPAKWPVVMAMMYLPLLVATELPESSLRAVAWTRSAGTPDELMASLPCLNDGAFCPPPKALLRLVQNDVPIDSVFAMDIEDEYQPSLFVPQQMVAWPGHAEGLRPRALFIEYFEQYDRAEAAHQGQPLFNDRETRAERLAFIRDLGVTHVLVNPRFHDLMAHVLGRDPDVFQPRYNDGRWALYEVASSYRGLRL